MCLVFTVFIRNVEIKFQYGFQIQNGGGNIALINNTCLIFTQISRAKNTKFCMYLECIPVQFIRNLVKNVKYGRQIQNGGCKIAFIHDKCLPETIEQRTPNFACI